MKIKEKVKKFWNSVDEYVFMLAQWLLNYLAAKKAQKKVDKDG